MAGQRGRDACRIEQVGRFRVMPSPAAPGRRDSAVTRCPRRAASAAMREPIMPVAPNSAIFKDRCVMSILPNK
ncbi:hypothetical protein CA831_36435, partial [Burkholderia multivorans]